MHIDDLVTRIRRLPSAKRKKLDEMVRSLEESPQEPAPAATGGEAAPRAALRPVRGLLRDLGPAPSDEAIDEARRELSSAGRAALDGAIGAGLPILVSAISIIQVIYL